MLPLLQSKRSPSATIIAALLLIALLAISAAWINLSLIVGNDGEGVSSIVRRLSGGYTIEHPKTFALRSLQSHEEATANADIVVLLTVSGGFFDMWINWLTFFEKLAIPNLPVLFFPEDEQAYQKCLRQAKDLSAAAADNSKYHANLTCLPWNFAFSDDNKIEDDVGALSYGTEGYKIMMARRPAIIQRELESGHNVIFSDVDVVWKQNPLPYIRERLDKGETHILAAGGIQEKAMCPGFMIYKSGPETIAFVDLWRQELKGKISNNQGPFNELLQQATEGKIDVDIVGEVLPKNLFSNGQDYFEMMDDDERRKVVVVHNNFIVGYKEKVDRMKEFGLWLMDE